MRAIFFILVILFGVTFAYLLSLADPLEKKNSLIETGRVDSISLSKNTIKILGEDGKENNIVLQPGTKFFNILGLPAAASQIKPKDYIQVTGEAEGNSILSNVVEVLDTQDPLLISEYDSGLEFSYPLNAPFTLLLNSRKSIKENIKCEPEGVLSPSSKETQAAFPLFTVSFFGQKKGTCLLSDGDCFSVNINILDLNFDESGFLRKSPDGQGWDFFYTQESGAFPLKLNFDQGAACFLEGARVTCNESSIKDGDGVRIKGFKEADILRVFEMIQEKNILGRVINLYCYNSRLDEAEDGTVLCGKDGLVPLEREVPLQSSILGALQLLLEGDLTHDEKSRNLTLEFPLKNFSLKEFSLQDGALAVLFDVGEEVNLDSCHKGILKMQIESLVRQFPEVKEVKLLPESFFRN